MTLTVTNPNGRPVVTAEEISTGYGSVSIAIDYTTYYARIATALETLATNSTTISTNIAGIKTDLDTISTNIATIKDDIHAVRSLGDKTLDGTGFRTVQPYHEISLAILWLLYIEKGKILELNLDSATISKLLNIDQTGNEDVRTASLARVQTLLARLKASFSAWGS